MTQREVAADVPTMQSEPGQPHEFEIDVQHAGTRCRVTIRGDVDVDVAPRVNAAVDEALGRGARRIETEMSGVTFLDSIGLSALIRSRDAVLATGASFHVTGASPAVTRILEITDLTDLLDPPDGDPGEPSAPGG
jgi:anti-sigma B factor antagonist